MKDVEFSPSTRLQPKLKENQVQPTIELEPDFFEMGDGNKSEVLVKSEAGCVRTVDTGDHGVNSSRLSGLNQRRN